MKILKKTYDYVLYLSETKYAFATLFLVSFLGSIFFPFPTEIIMIPMILARPKKAWSISSLALMFSVLGGLAGYYVGAFLFDTVGIKILEVLHYQDMFEQFKTLYSKWDYWIVFAGGLTPFPYKVICIASGVVGMNIPLFIIASAVSRALRYYFIAFLLKKYGDDARMFIEKNLEMLTIIAFVLLFMAVYFVKMM
ncbi:MAG: DedA family protein [bacterium]|nr:DedA family protein [bacterium]